MARRKSLEKYKNIHQNKRCFVILTGPSLTLHDVELLKDEITFSCNSIYKMFDKTDWRPTYYALTDRRVFVELGPEIIPNLKNIPVFYSGLNVSWTTPFAKSEPFNTKWISHFFYFFFKHTTTLGWSDDIARGVVDAPTVAYAILQIASYMGFSEIYLLGADSDYSAPKQHSTLVGYKHKHKIPKHAGKDVIRTYLSAAKALKKRKKAPRIINVTRGGKLEVFPRANLEDVLKENKS